MDAYKCIYNYDELYHHGVKGQKWGRRRFQNPDGSLTQEGYQHYGMNPDGSRYRKGHYSKSTVSGSKRGAAIGTAIGTGVGALTANPTAALIGGVAGMHVGAVVGTGVGAINTKVKRAKIKRLLDQNGKVYVKDI